MRLGDLAAVLGRSAALGVPGGRAGGMPVEPECLVMHRGTAAQQLRRGASVLPLLLALLCASNGTGSIGSSTSSAGVCITSGSSDGLQACAAGGGITFARGNRTIVTSSTLIAAGRRIALNAAAASADHQTETLALQVKDAAPVRTPGHPAVNASYSVTVTIADGRFEVSVDAITGPAPPPLPNCSDGPIAKALNPHGGDLRHARQPNDSAEPVLILNVLSTSPSDTYILTFLCVSLP